MTESIGAAFEDGQRAVEAARDAVEGYVREGRRENLGSMYEGFYARTGAFVRLESTRGRGRLRGCAGDYESSDHLGERIVDAAVTAASDASRDALRPAELDDVCVSVCIVEDARRCDDPRTDVEIGRDGVVVEARSGSGWLYPTVPVENGWSPADYLERTCRSADLPPTAWRDDDTAVVRFSGHVFRERAPGGGVEHVQ